MGFRGSSPSGGGAVTYGPPSGQVDIGDAQIEGVDAAVTRADHQHAYPGAAGAPPAVAAAGVKGVSARPAHEEHTHSHTAAMHTGAGHASLDALFAATGAPAAAVTAHEAAGDPHPGYLTQAEGDGRYPLDAEAVLQSEVTAKGQVLGATGAGVVAPVAAGTDGEYLMADSAEATGARFAAGPSAGVTDHGALAGLADDDHRQYGRRIAGSATTVTVTTTTAESTLFTTNLPTDLAAGDVLRLRAIIGTEQAATSVARTLRLKIGATTVLNGFTSLAGNISPRAQLLDCDLYVVSANAQRVVLSLVGAGTENGAGQLVNPVVGCGLIGYGTAAEDTTAAKALALTVQHNDGAAAVKTHLLAWHLTRLAA